MRLRGPLEPPSGAEHLHRFLGSVPNSYGPHARVSPPDLVHIAVRAGEAAVRPITPPLGGPRRDQQGSLSKAVAGLEGGGGEGAGRRPRRSIVASRPVEPPSPSTT